MEKAEEERLKSHSDKYRENTDLAVAEVDEQPEKTGTFSRDFQNSSKWPNNLDSQVPKC
jgi:hypothetical protein